MNNLLDRLIAWLIERGWIKDEPDQPAPVEPNPPADDPANETTEPFLVLKRDAGYEMVASNEYKCSSLTWLPALRKPAWCFYRNSNPRNVCRLYVDGARVGGDIDAETLGIMPDGFVVAERGRCRRLAADGKSSRDVGPDCRWAHTVVDGLLLDAHPKGEVDKDTAATRVTDLASGRRWILKDCGIIKSGIRWGDNRYGAVGDGAGRGVRDLDTGTRWACESNGMIIAFGLPLVLVGNQVRVFDPHEQADKWRVLVTVKECKKLRHGEDVAGRLFLVGSNDDMLVQVLRDGSYRIEDRVPDTTGSGGEMFDTDLASDGTATIWWSYAVSARARIRRFTIQ